MASWTTPSTQSTGFTVGATEYNGIVNDILFLAGTASNTVATSETTTSTTYTNLATAGPSVTVTTGANALVILDCQLSNNTAAAVALMGFDISGATTSTISGGSLDTWSIYYTSAAGGATIAMSRVVFRSGLNAGSNTFTAKYRASSNTATFANRTITVIPLP